MKDHQFPLIEVSGNAYEMGYQHGAQTADMVERYLLWIEKLAAKPRDLLCRSAMKFLPVLEAAQATGGDNRGRQAAAIQVHWKRIDANPCLDIRVDDHPNPIPELRATVKNYRQAFPQYSSRTWPRLQGTGGYPILYPGNW